MGGTILRVVYTDCWVFVEVKSTSGSLLSVRLVGNNYQLAQGDVLWWSTTKQRAYWTTKEARSKRSIDRANSRSKLNEVAIEMYTLTSVPANGG